MDYLPGSTVAQRLAAGPLPEAGVCELGEQMAWAAGSGFGGSFFSSFFRYGTPSLSHFGAGAPFR
jgi:hypothetical protein